MGELVRGRTQVCNFPAGPKETAKLLMVPFTDMGNGGAEVWMDTRHP